MGIDGMFRAAKHVCALHAEEPAGRDGNMGRANPTEIARAQPAL
jgi:hypothetical protein